MFIVVYLLLFFDVLLIIGKLWGVLFWVGCIMGGLFWDGCCVKGGLVVELEKLFGGFKVGFFFFFGCSCFVLFSSCNLCVFFNRWWFMVVFVVIGLLGVGLIGLKSRWK